MPNGYRTSNKELFKKSVGKPRTTLALVDRRLRCKKKNKKKIRNGSKQKSGERERSGDSEVRIWFHV
jgi:hypothetical protein